MKKALITGSFGQDDSYLREILTKQVYHHTCCIARIPLSNQAQAICAQLKFKGITPIVHGWDC